MWTCSLLSSARELACWFLHVPTVKWEHNYFWSYRIWFLIFTRDPYSPLGDRKGTNIYGATLTVGINYEYANVEIKSIWAMWKVVFFYIRLFIWKVALWGEGRRREREICHFLVHYFHGCIKQFWGKLNQEPETTLISHVPHEDLSTWVILPRFSECVGKKLGRKWRSQDFEPTLCCGMLISQLAT